MEKMRKIVATNLVQHMQICQVHTDVDWLSSQEEIVGKGEQKREGQARSSQQYTKANGAVFSGP